jgi:hypothetical protein
MLDFGTGGRRVRRRFIAENGVASPIRERNGQGKNRDTYHDSA